MQGGIMIRINGATAGVALRALIIAMTLALADQANAFSSGITTASFGVNGCNQCHSGGVAPTVTLTGPTTVAPNSTNEYTFQILGTPPQVYGGLNVSTPDGVLSVGGANSAQTQTLPNLALVPEVTHSSPKAADASNTVTFSFKWTAPSSFTTATLTAWGNSVNFNHSPSGDKAAMTTLVIASTEVDTPTPTATFDTPTPTDTPEVPHPTDTPAPMQTPTATATPTAVPVCPANVSGKKPLLVGDDPAERCQEGIAKAGFLYAKARFKAAQKCLKKFHKGTFTGDPIAVCHGSLAVPPTDAATAQQIANADMKARAAIDDRCASDAAVAALDTCGDTIADAKTCVIATHFQLVEDALDAEYGALAASTEKDVQQCQATIGKAAAKYFTTKLHAIQKCLNKRNKSGVTGDAAALCMDAVVDGAPVAPTDTSTADRFAKAETKMRALIDSKCSDSDVSALDACGEDRTGVENCLVCSHRIGVLEGIGSEYGGADGVFP